MKKKTLTIKLNKKEDPHEVEKTDVSSPDYESLIAPNSEFDLSFSFFKDDDNLKEINKPLMFPTRESINEIDVRDIECEFEVPP